MGKGRGLVVFSYLDFAHGMTQNFEVILFLKFRIKGAEHHNICSIYYTESLEGTEYRNIDLNDVTVLCTF